MHNLSSILAVSDEATFWMFGINLVFTLGLALGLGVIARMVTRIDRAEDKRESDVNALEAKLHEANTKLVDTRLRDMTHDLREKVNSVGLALEVTARRMQGYDAQFDKVLSSSPAQLVKMVEDMSDLKDEFRRSMDEQRKETDVRCQHTDRKIDELRERVLTRDDLRFLQGGDRRG